MGLLDPINPLTGLTGTPGVSELPGAESYVTGQGIQGGLNQLVDAISQKQNPLLAAGRVGLGFVGGQQQGMQNLANFQKLRQDLMKGGLDITQSKLNIGEKQFDLGRKVSQQQNLYNLIRNLSPDQKALALSNEEEFSKMMISNMQLTGSTKEYEYAVANGYTGSYTDYVREVEKYRAPSTTVTYGAQQAFSKTLQEDEAKRLSTTVNETIPKSSQNVLNLQQTLSIIEKGDLNTGLLADIKTNLDRARAIYSKDPKLVERLTDTQLVDAALGADVFKAIGELGIGARGIDTIAEREFLRKVLTGKISLEKSTLIDLTKKRLNKEKAIIERYNKDLKSGRYKRYQDELGIKLDPVDLGDSQQQQGVTPNLRYNPVTRQLEPV
jgi:hypothetical protein